MLMKYALVTTVQYRPFLSRGGEADQYHNNYTYHYIPSHAPFSKPTPKLS